MEKIIEIIKQDTRVGNSHMDVPGPDGERRSVFSKRHYALIKFAEQNGTEFNLLKTAIIINNNIRSEYNTVTTRELSQNISFDEES